MSGALMTVARDSFAEGGAALVDLTRALTAAADLQQLEHAFASRCGRLMAAPMCGFYALDRTGSRIEHNVGVNVSDYFVARYIRAMEVDPLLTRSRETQGPVYNLGLMSEAEWQESTVYRDAYCVHRMRHVVEVPIVDDGGIVGALHFATSEPERNFTDTDLRLARTIASVLAISLGGIRQRQDAEQALEEALAALAITGVALAMSSTASPELRLNEAARHLLSELVDGDASSSGSTRGCWRCSRRGRARSQRSWPTA
jgi:GAF domain-containing protein